jgi:hypothetical protein
VIETSCVDHRALAVQAQPTERGVHVLDADHASNTCVLWLSEMAASISANCSLIRLDWTPAGEVTTLSASKDRLTPQ